MVKLLVDRFVTPPPSKGVVSQSDAPWGVVSNKVV
eukprot:COSAG01_NODE_39072_length_481_cov_1.162304_1_plen_34_part_01